MTTKDNRAPCVNAEMRHRPRLRREVLKVAEASELRLLTRAAPTFAAEGSQ